MSVKPDNTQLVIIVPYERLQVANKNYQEK